MGTIADGRGSSFRKLIELGIALSVERDTNRLMERILVEAKALSGADGGTLYLMTEDKTGLRFEIMRTESLSIAMGGTTGKPIPFPPLRLYDDDGLPNLKNVATYAALSGQTINIPDAYNAEGFDFSGAKKFDAGTGYRSQSFLTVPLRNHEAEVIGVLQLLNAQSDADEVIAFSEDIQPLIEALASQAAVALNNQQLLESQRNLFKSFIEVLANAIDTKSPYTGGHCKRVPEICLMLAEAACQEGDGPFAQYQLTEDEWYELEVAAGLHDCGKVTTPEYVVDKATKLETIYDRIDLVRHRFEILRRDAEIAYLRAVAEPGAEADALKAEFEATLSALDDDLAFLETANIGGEFMGRDKIERVEEIAKRRWTDHTGADRPLLTENEVYNLAIERGTLTSEERKVINDHVVMTIRMLEQLPFPKNLSRVIEIAGGHHEKLDGSGYPNGLTAEQLSTSARILAVADIFEALTASDRPYKKAKTLSESIRIMSFMVKDNHIDRDVFELLLRHGLHNKYADAYLKPDQRDEVDIGQYLTGPELKDTGGLPRARNASAA